MAVENLFNADFYRAINPDLANLSSSQASSHFEQSGLNEGRRFSPYVDLNFYRASNSDLSSLDNRQLYDHLRNRGISEGRKFSPLIDLEYYRSYRSNPSNLRRLNYEQAFEDLRNTGLSDENRYFSPYVNLNLYKKVNPDISNLSLPQAFEHLQIRGLKEGRLFDDIVDLGVYLNENPDLAQAYGGNRELALQHLQLNGLNEGRKFSRFFDLNYYKSQNADFANASLTGSQLFNHFELNGVYEGRPGRPDLAGNAQDSALTINNVTSGPQFFFDNVGIADPEDYYRFTLNEAKNFSIFAESFGTPVNAEFFSADRRLVSDTIIPNRAGAARFDLQLIPGTYYLRLTPTAGGNGNYGFVISPT